MITPESRIGKFAGKTLKSAKPTAMLDGPMVAKVRSKKHKGKTKSKAKVPPGLINR